MLPMVNYLKKDFTIYLILIFIGLNSLNILFETNAIEVIDYFILWLVLGALFLTLYFIRFKRKVTVVASDYLKLGIIVMTPLVPIVNLYSYNYSGNRFLGTVSVVYFILLISIYYYDYILKPITMKRNFIIAFILQSLVVLLCVLYAYVQMMVANEQRRLAEEQKMHAEEQRTIAQRERADTEKKYEEILKLKASLDSLKIKIQKRN